MLLTKWISSELHGQHLLFWINLYLVSYVSADNEEAESFSELRFTQEPSDTIGIRDQPLLLQCSATHEGGPQPAITWARDGVDISSDEQQRRQVLNNGSLHFSSLVHTRAHRPDEGVYQCRASVPSLGSILSSKASLQIAYISREFTLEPQDLKVYLGDTAVFACLIEGAPEPSVRWYKDGMELRPQDTPRLTLHLDGTLEIANVHFDDFGRYHCKAENVDKARDSEEALLTQNSDIASFQAGVAPSFILTPRDRVALEGSPVELLCAANGRDDSGKSPRITWLKDGVTIEVEEEDSRYSVTGQGSLRILGALEGDSGTYTCRARNDEDAVDADAAVTVQVAPRFQRRPSNTVARESSDVTLLCDVYGAPQPSIVWMKNGEVIINSNYFQVSDGGRSLEILGLVAQDRGVYQCFAENAAGNVQASAQLAVTPLGSAAGNDDSGNGNGATSGDSLASTELPSAPTHVMAFLVSKRFVTLSWRPPTSPGTSDILNYIVYWTEEGSERQRMQNTTAMEANIQDLEPATTYTFRVSALNTAGAGPATAIIVTTEQEVSVPPPPQQLTAATLSSTSIQVTWQPPAQLADTITHYVIYFFEAGETEEHSKEVGELSYTFSELQEFVLYSFYVVAHNENGAGQATREVMARTLSDVPSAPPQNVTVESVSSTAVVLRWQPPQAQACNGMITGYKIRYKKDGDRKGAAVTEDASQRSFSLNDLEAGASYQIRIQALNVNGSGPPTEWLTAMTYIYDLDESTVPGQPLSLDVRPMIDSVVVAWIPPPNRDIRVRGYVLGYGIGRPDTFRIVLDHKTRFHTIKNLVPGKEYVISLRAYNNQGEGQEKLTATTTRAEQPVESQTPMLPPVGLKALTLSPFAIIVTWSDSSLGRSQRVSDNRFYTIRYGQANQGGRFKYINCTELNQHIDGLKPNIEYEFSVKVTKGRRNSPYSLTAVNRTFESMPTSAPRDLTPVAVDKKHPTWVSLSWQPPRNPNGQITGYLVLYTTDAELSDRDWVVEGIRRGDQLTTTIRDLTPQTTYYFKVHARNSKGNSPMSPTVIYRTPRVDGTGGGRVELPNDYGKNHPVGNGPKNRNQDAFDVDQYYLDRAKESVKDGQEAARKGAAVAPLLLYASVACIGAVALIAVTVVTVIMCRRKNQQNKRGYTAANQKGAPKPGPTPKPPDLWIHHEQVELKPVDKSRDPEEVDEMKPLNSDYSGLDSVMDARRNSFVSERPYDDRYHRTPHRSKPITISLEHQPPPPQPIATALPNGHVMTDEDGLPLMPQAMRPMYPRTQYSSQYMSTPRVQAPSHDFSPPASEDSYSTATVERRKPKLNQDALKPHGSTSVLTEAPHSPQPPALISPAPSSQSSAAAPGDSLPSPHPPGYSQEDPMNNSKSLPRPGNPLKSFKIPGPPTAVKPPLVNTSPYKKPSAPSSSSSHGSGSPAPPPAAPLTSPPIKPQPRPPLPPTTAHEPGRTEVDADLPKSFSTEELTAEMANLEGLMKDLNYITQQDFEC